jgi:hypothetical protein
VCDALAGVLNELCACLGQLDHLVIALEKAHVEQAFQFNNSFGKGGLVDAKPHGRSGEVQFLRQDDG